MLRVKYRGLQPQLSELSQTWEMLCFPSTIGVDSRSFQSYLKRKRRYAFHQLLELKTIAFKSYLEPRRLYASHQLLELRRQLQLSELSKSCQPSELTSLSTIACRTTKILSTIRVGNCSFSNYPKKYLTSCHLSQLTTVAFKVI